MINFSRLSRGFTLTPSQKKYAQTKKRELTFNTSCNDDMLPNGLGERGKDGGCSLGLAGAVLFAPLYLYIFLLKCFVSMSKK
jgi:hypothetical protein